MWELASVLNFLQVFRPLLNIAVEFTAEELEDALIVPNGTLEGLHVPLLRSIPPVARMSMADGKWVTVLCRKLNDWWHLVAEGNLPIVASHGAEIETYKELEPATRLMILKAICDIRCEVNSNQPMHYRYDEDPILGHRLYREIRQVEYVKEQTRKSKRKGFLGVPVVSYQWETVATNFVEFEAAAEKLFSSSNRTEVSLGKKLKLNYLPEMEKTHKKKEKLLKKQQREALLLNSYLTFDRFTSGRSHRERKRVTYTFGKVRTLFMWLPLPTEEYLSQHERHQVMPLKSYSYQGSGGEEKAETLDRRSRQRKRSQRYTTDFVENVSDIDTNFDSDGDIMGEAVYDEEYLRSRKQPKASTSEYDGEFRSEDQAEYSLSSEDEEGIQRSKRLPSRSPQGTRLKSMDVIQTGIKRNKRSARPHMNHQRCSGKDSGLGKPGELNTSDPDAGSGALDSANTSIKSQEQRLLHIVKMHAPGREESKVGGRRFLHLNLIAPAGGFDGAPVRS
ncbi:unnamed protein product [Triticum turgidum subsp. durum]|uniref:DDT domain-containing protein n=1 Tax=Triticum turgidum subsp. durum TaxID=4567 RepID=A0A9R0WUF2_TRITD|nr:unnamed protein product [Triticum turgidum subsp. durum]